MTQVDEPRTEPGAVLAKLPYRIADDGTRVYQIPIPASGKSVVKPRSPKTRDASKRRRGKASHGEQ